MLNRYEIIKKAYNELGYREGKNNDSKYGKWYGLNFNPWCVMFVQWLYSDIPKIYRTASTSKLYEYYKGKLTKNPKPADIVILKGHTEIYLRDIDGVYFYSLGGNVSDMVKITKRKYYDVMGFISLINEQYKGVKPSKIIYKGSKGDEVKRLQQFLNAVNGCNLDIDGSYGKLTTAEVVKLQKYHNIPAGGDVGYNTLKVINYY